jgi:hypothetical protein
MEAHKYSETFENISKNLHNLAEQISKTEPIDSCSLRITFNDMRGNETGKKRLDKICPDFRQWQNKSNSYFIYIITPDDKIEISQYHEQFKKAKQDSNRAFSRINKEGNAPITFYVGSSKSLLSRIEQHLGFGTERVYALHMNRWIENLKGAITIECLEFARDVGMDVVQAIEDGLWAEKKPIFGRRGSK